MRALSYASAEHSALGSPWHTCSETPSPLPAGNTTKTTLQKHRELYPTKEDNRFNNMFLDDNGITLESQQEETWGVCI